MNGTNELATGFRTRPVALTIAGSDSGGGAGVQADLRVFHRLGVFGTSAITAITAQNLAGVTDVIGVGSGSVRAQIDAVLAGFPVRAAKTGMLFSRAVVETVAEVLGRHDLPLIVDPVMVATSGARLLDEDAVDAYRERLLPHATLATPNLDEAGVLLESLPPPGVDSLREAADALFGRFGCAVLLKGGHLEGDPVDVLCHAGGSVAWRHRRIEGVNTHGSGCMLAAGIAARLAHGDALVDAVECGLALVHSALANACSPGPGAGPEARLADIERARPDVTVLERLPRLT